jgi:hypothetical protein
LNSRFDHRLAVLWSLVATYIEETDHLDRTRVVVK